MIKNLCILILLFPITVYADKPSGQSDEHSIQSLVTDFYSSSGDKKLGHRYELLSKSDKEILNKNNIINTWAHQLTAVTLKKIKKISVREDFAEVTIEINIKSLIDDFSEVKSISLFVKREQGQWKIAYLYFQPPVFIEY